MLLRTLAALAAFSISAAAEAKDVPAPAALDVAAVPHLSVEGRADYQRFLRQATPRAFAMASSGAWGWAAAQTSIQDAEARALELCRELGETPGGPCRVYVRDLAVVWPGRESSPLTGSEKPILSGGLWSLVPDGRFFWHGARRAKGVIVWGHGRTATGDSRGSQPNLHVRAFNNAGWDVVRFDRNPDTDHTDIAAEWMRGALRTVRSMGYRRVVAGGQSRGGWNALQTLNVPGLVDGVIADAPAAHGGEGSAGHAFALTDLRQVALAARNPRARVVVGAFRDDEYEPDLPARVDVLRGLLGPRVGHVLVLTPPDLTGHAVGNSSAFAQEYGDCIVEYIESGANSCPGSAGAVSLMAGNQP